MMFCNGASSLDLYVMFVVPACISSFCAISVRLHMLATNLDMPRCCLRVW